jgi:hypothetical protein
LLHQLEAFVAIGSDRRAPGRPVIDVRSATDAMRSALFARVSTLMTQPTTTSRKPAYRPAYAEASQNSGYADHLRYKYWHFIDEPFSTEWHALQQPGDDPCPLPLSMREAHLERLLARRPDGIFVSPFEQGEIGPDLFRKACEFGLEGLVSKRKDRHYRGGRSKDWIKMKNRSHHAFNRVNDSFS